MLGIRYVLLANGEPFSCWRDAGAPDRQLARNLRIWFAWYGMVRVRNLDQRELQ